ncbi:MAG: hypothetical protein ACRENL_05735 [Candidatus Dormibacteria bacterium]
MVIAVQVVLLGFALASVPLRLIDSWPIWAVLVLAASLVLYGVLAHPDVPVPVATASLAGGGAPPPARPSPWATAGHVIGISAGIVTVLVFAAMGLLLAVVLIVLQMWGRSG